MKKSPIKKIIPIHTVHTYTHMADNPALEKTLDNDTPIYKN